MLYLPPFTGYSRAYDVRTTALVNSGLDTISQAVVVYKLDAVFALFSGGHDSLTMAHLASKHPKFAGIIHIDTGTGLPETRAFVDATCKRYGWPLVVKKPAITYEMQLIKVGFPGPAQHGMMYSYLKERPLRQAKIAARKLVKPRARIGFITGVRTQESDRRMGHVDTMRKDSEGVWVNPIHDWSKLDCTNYMRIENLQRSQVVDTMHMSGECFCGSFARPEEKRELDLWYPAQGRKIEAWETLVRTAKELKLLDATETHCRWGHGAGKRIADEQTEMFPMCWFCRSDTLPMLALTEASA